MQTGLETGIPGALGPRATAAPFLMTLTEDLHFPNTDDRPHEESDWSSDVRILFFLTN